MVISNESVFALARKPDDDLFENVIELKTVSNDQRRAKLRALLKQKRCLRVIEAHSAVSAILAESAYCDDEFSGRRIGYDAFWSSSLTDSTLRGQPDIEALDIRSRLTTIDQIFDVTTRPLIIDGDTGGRPEHFELNVRSLDRAGVSAVIIEDKVGLKKNSLLGNEVVQQQDSIAAFQDKIRRGKNAQRSADFMIIARIESLVLDAGMGDALDRADAYVAAGADGIMIHSRHRTADEVLEFVARFRASHPGIVLVCVPTSYADVHFADLESAGLNVVIYANHMLRSACLAMRNVASEILRRGRTREVENACIGVNEILSLIPGTR